MVPDVTVAVVPVVEVAVVAVVAEVSVAVPEGIADVSVAEDIVPVSVDEDIVPVSVAVTPVSLAGGSSFLQETANRTRARMASIARVFFMETPFLF